MAFLWSQYVIIYIWFKYSRLRIIGSYPGVYPGISGLAPFEIYEICLVPKIQISQHITIPQYFSQPNEPVFSEYIFSTIAGLYIEI